MMGIICRPLVLASLALVELTLLQLRTCPLCNAYGYFTHPRYKTLNFIDISWSTVIYSSTLLKKLHSSFAFPCLHSCTRLSGRKKLSPAGRSLCAQPHRRDRITVEHQPSPKNFCHATFSFFFQDVVIFARCIAGNL